MVRIAVAGAAGKMGGRITALSREYDGLTLAGAFEREGHADVGKDIGPIAGIGETGIKLAGGISNVIDAVDVVIDFTSVESTKNNLKIAAAAGFVVVVTATH